MAKHIIITMQLCHVKGTAVHPTWTEIMSSVAPTPMMSQGLYQLRPGDFFEIVTETLRYKLEVGRLKDVCSPGSKGK